VVRAGGMALRYGGIGGAARAAWQLDILTHFGVNQTNERKVS
jgi:hypothetical protein